MAYCCDHCGLPVAEAVLEDGTDLYEFFMEHLEAAHDIEDTPAEHVHGCG